MAEATKQPAYIDASVTIEGPAEEILAAIRMLRGGRREVHLSVEVPTRHYSDSLHSLPVIKDGQTQAAMQKLETMSRQTVIDGDTDKRLARLIKEFGQFTTAR